MINLKTENNLAAVAELEAGGMDHVDAMWFIEMHNMVVHVFHDNPEFAFQDSASGVLERYKMLEAQAQAIFGGETVPQVLSLGVVVGSTREVMALVDDAVSKMRIGLSHYGDEAARESVLAAEGGRIATALRTDTGENSPVIDRVTQMMTLNPDDRILVERALALHEGRPETTKEAASRMAADVQELRPTG
tara:strand:+ start:116 stop:688 length:573 start_codon:yes stop_codon:yes gene_type:complete